MTPDPRLSIAQRKLLDIARSQGWVRPSGANDMRTATALVNKGLLEKHPSYESGVYRARTTP